MIRWYCDRCGDELLPLDHGRLKSEAADTFMVEVVTGYKGTWNDGNLCRSCTVLTVVQLLAVRDQFLQGVASVILDAILRMPDDWRTRDPHTHAPRVSYAVAEAIDAFRAAAKAGAPPLGPPSIPEATDS